MSAESGKIPADLAAAASGDAAASPAAPVAVAPAVRDWRREAADIVDVVASLRHVFPSLAAIYTPQTCAELANAWAPILERHDIDLGKFMIYFTAAGVTVPVAVATGRAIKGDIAAAKTGRPAPAAVASEPGIPSPEPATAARASDPDLPDKPNVPLTGAGPAEAPAPAIS